MTFGLSSKDRLVITIAISFSFFVAEITVAFKTGSLALLADAFHYIDQILQMNDLISLVVALTAVIISERAKSPQDLSFGWQRASLLGAFFNGVFLLALGISIFLQSIERFISIEQHHGHDHSHDHGHGDDQVTDHDDPETVDLGPIVTDNTKDQDGNAFRTHAEHRHNVAQLKKPGRDLGMLGVLVHVIGDAINNIGVIIAAVIIWQTQFEARFYADPAASMFISIMIFVSAIPLTRNSGAILLQSAPRGVEIEDVKHDLEQIPGIESVHELHIWRLDQQKAIASAHVVVSSDQSVSSFSEKARTVNECLHAYGIHSATLQPETVGSGEEPGGTREGTAHGNGSVSDGAGSSLRRRRLDPAACQMICSSLCHNLMCCTKIET
ncbi:hypothetical protein VMCG_02532 [Cytospora schulzeri]|uniref:Cation efflux protein cytoplasmic domain-containing protein n=1 Tax=Cytospora schulzeri TaxID=448051 RepID=A0A423X155_9PEZI|nr:hypothetical protein VMCG_02532 [Valsa malicola]